jgi:hypothetical protein
MRNISAENLAALEARQLVARDFLWFVARDRATGAPVTDGMWSDVGDVSANRRSQMRRRWRPISSASTIRRWQQPPASRRGLTNYYCLLVRTAQPSLIWKASSKA